MLLLVTELVFHVSTFLNPTDILHLSSTCSRLGGTLRHPFPFVRQIAQAGWDVEALVRRFVDSQEWLPYARSAIDKHALLRIWELEDCVRLHSTCSPLEGMKSFRAGHQYIRRVAQVISEHDRFNIDRLPHTAFDNICKIATNDPELEYLQSFAMAGCVYHETCSSGSTFNATSNSVQNLYTLLSKFSRPEWLATLGKRKLPAFTSKSHLLAATYTNLLYARLHVAFNFSAHILPRLLPTRPIPSSLYDPSCASDLLAWAPNAAHRWYSSGNEGVASVTGFDAFQATSHPMVDEAPTHATLHFQGKKGQFTGKGEDSLGSFTVAGKMNHLAVTFVKTYLEQTMERHYLGFVLPWGWVGHWCPAGGPLVIVGDFYMWLDQDR